MHEILEPFGPLSKSTIWTRLADVYRGGLAAWDTVPATVTGNALVGDLFAGAVEAWLFDQGDAVDVAAPLYVVELGAGTGLFSHHFLTAVARRRARGTLPHPRIVLVMCDQSDAQIDEWSGTEALAAHARAGTLDFATYAVDEHGPPGPIVLKRGGQTLSSLTNPLVVVANYFFDSIPTDAFRVRDGRIFEARTRFVRTRETPDFEGFQNEEKIVAIGADHYGDAALDSILPAYARDKREASVLMPIAALRCLQSLMQASDRRMLLLSIDKGITAGDRLDGWHKQPFVTHGGVFSYLVNFDALRRYFEANDGAALCSSSDDRGLACCVGMLPAPAASGGHLNRFFVNQIDSVDAFNANVSFAQAINAFPVATQASQVEPVLDLVTRMRADPDAFAGAIYRTVGVLADAEKGVRSLARRLAAMAKENFLSPRFHNDVFYWSGRMHYALGDLDLARQDFETSVSRFAAKSQAHFFLGVLAEQRDDIDTASQHYALHRALQPECKATRAAIRRVRAKLRKRQEPAPRGPGRGSRPGGGTSSGVASAAVSSSASD